MAEQDYARPELIAETEWLAERLGGPGMRVIEMGTTAEDFEAGHIPGAVLCEDWHLKRADNSPLVVTPLQAKQLFESLGVGDDTLVIAYDRNRSRDASRLWWVLTYYGHANVKVLDGGWVTWRNEGRRVEVGAGRSNTVSAATFTPAERPEMLSTIDALKAAMGRSDAVIWDTRSREEYVGENDRGNKRRGHVPGARHLEWLELVNEDHSFKSAEELRRLVEGVGVSADKAVHTY